MKTETENKKVDFKEVSNQKCNHCNRPLKENVVRRGNPYLCYCCYKLSIGKDKMTYHKKIRNSDNVREKIVDFKEKQRLNRVQFKYNGK